MRIILDTSEKTVKIESNINLQEFMEGIKELIPEDKIAEYTIDTGAEFVWDPNYPYTFQTPIIDQPFIVTCQENNATPTYQIELKSNN